MKELLKITEIKDGICSAEAGCESRQDWERLSASVLSLMARSEEFAGVVCSAAYIYASGRHSVEAATDAAIRSAKNKTQN